MTAVRRMKLEMTKRVRRWRRERARPAKAESAPPIGSYVLATKYHDGDPGDRWAVGFYAGMEHDRHMVKDSAGKNIHVGGYRGVIRIPFDVGDWLLKSARVLESSPPGAVNLLQMVATQFNADRIAEEVAVGEPRRINSLQRADYLGFASIGAKA